MPKVDLFGVEGAKQIITEMESISSRVNSALDKTDQSLVYAKDASIQSLTQSGAVRFVDDAERESNPRPSGVWGYTLSTQQFHRSEGGKWVYHGDGVVGSSELTQPPLKRPYSGRTYLPGGRTMYPVPDGDLSPEDGITIVKFRGQKYYKTSMVCDAREFNGVKSGSLDVQVDSTEGLLDFMGTAQRDITMSLPKGFYYTKKPLTVGNLSGVRYDFLGTLRPWKSVDNGDPQMTDYLVRHWGGQRAEDGRFGSIAEGNAWGDTSTVVRMILDGRWLSRGYQAHLLDHFVLDNIQVHRTNGAAFHFSNLREGSSSGCVAAHCMSGPDKGVILIQDKDPGWDANNSFVLNGLQSVWHLGRNLFVDRHDSSDPGNVPRLLDFVGCHFEDIPGSGRPYGGTETLQLQDPLLDRNWIRSGFGITFSGGIINGGKLGQGSGSTTQEKNLSGGSALRLGDSSDSTRDPIRFITFAGVKWFGLEGAGAMLKLDKASAIEQPPEMLLTTGISPVVISPSSSITEIKRFKTNYEGLGSDELLSIVSKGGDNSPPIVMQSENGSRIRQYVRNDGTFVVEHNNGKNFVSDLNGNIFGEGNQLNLGLGVAGREIRRVMILPRTSPPSDATAGTVSMCLASASWNPGSKVNGTVYPVYLDGSGVWKVFGS